MKKGKLVGKGAEGELYLINWEGKKSVEKIRVSKAYRHPTLDSRLRKRRTAREAKILRSAQAMRAHCPQLYSELEESNTLVIQWIDGQVLSRYFESPKTSLAEEKGFMAQAGTILAKLHGAGIVHGDFTTSNLMVDVDGKVYVIDFGLSEFSKGIEEKAIDLLLFEKSLAPTGRATILFKEFFNAYLAVDKQAQQVMERAKLIFSRGRYQQRAQ